ncbi:RNA-guided endonuclease TnpB family protein [Arthrobacter sp. MYb227]|uniref:RNA-guided endonuclease InsQ/TnpB family protein n=1 Tax=Arthrobacter sp. MYb227 TaxID=1848601 RepID=UPI001C612DAD|nr:RNA-guided endonuclease TnpB family protein [Arthrobacter sp. MYb227]
MSETATTARVDRATGVIDEATAWDLPHQEHGKRTAQEHATAQRQIARRRKPKGQEQTHGYRLARFKAARAHKKVARQRKDDAHKWAKKLVSDHQYLAVEDFKPKFIAKSTMARKAAEATIATTKAILIFQALKAGRTLKLVSPRYTTMDCAHCGARAKHRLPLGERTYSCTGCGVSRSRDKNSAAVMVDRAGFSSANTKSLRLALAAVPQRAA